MNNQVVIGISKGVDEDFQKDVSKLGITVIEVPEPDDWMDRIVDGDEDKRILKEILSATDCPIKFKHYTMTLHDFNFLRLNIDYEKYKVLNYVKFAPKLMF